MKKLLLFAVLLFISFSVNLQTVRGQEEDAGNTDTSTTTSPVSYSAADCQKRCGACVTTPPNRDCNGKPAYDTCIDLNNNPQSDTTRFCKNSMYYRCYAKDNPNCSSSHTLLCSACPNGKNQDKNTTLESATCYTDCRACETKYTLGQTTYNTCTDNKGGNTGNGTLCSNGATKFGCHASLNNNCQSGDMEYDCPTSETNTDSISNKPAAISSSVSCSSQGNNLDINIGWSIPIKSADGNSYYQKSVMVTLYQTNGGAVGTSCVDGNTANYTFSGNYSSAKAYQASIIAYNSPNCTGTLLAQSGKQNINKTSCGSDTQTSTSFTLDRFLFRGDDININGGDTRTFKLDGIEGTPQSFPTITTAIFSKGANKVYKPYPITFIYKPKPVTAVGIYNISPAPGLVDLSTKKQTGLTFTWSEIPDATKYKLVVSGFGPRIDKETTTTSYTVPWDQFRNTDYTWSVTAYDPSGNALKSQDWRITVTGSTSLPGEMTNCNAIACPTNLQSPSGIVYGTDPVKLSWINPVNTTQYQIQVTPFSHDGPSINQIEGRSNLVTQASFTVSAPKIGEGNYILLPGMTYSWRVRTSTSLNILNEYDPGWSKWSDGRNFKTSTPASVTIRPVLPQIDYTVSSLTPTLTWTNANTSIFYYEVQLSKDNTFNTDPKTATATVHWMVIHGGETSPLNSYHVSGAYKLEPNTKYYWRVRPRVQGDGTPVDWTDVWTFMTPAE